jgi:hypothetical protein
MVGLAMVADADVSEGRVELFAYLRGSADPWLKIGQET